MYEESKTISGPHNNHDESDLLPVLPALVPCNFLCHTCPARSV